MRKIVAHEGVTIWFCPHEFGPAKRAASSDLVRNYHFLPEDLLEQGLLCPRENVRFSTRIERNDVIDWPRGVLREDSTNAQQCDDENDSHTFDRFMKAP